MRTVLPFSVAISLVTFLICSGSDVAPRNGTKIRKLTPTSVCDFTYTGFPLGPIRPFHWSDVDVNVQPVSASAIDPRTMRAVDRFMGVPPNVNEAFLRSRPGPGRRGGG